MISHFFIDRPIFAAVISIVIVIAGLVAMANLPIAQYPEITPPVIQVQSTYPGASADVVSQNIAAPIELQVNGADNMLYMTSTCSNTGSMTMSISFEIGTNPDLAQVDIQNRVNLALPQLPDAVQRQGVQIKKTSSSFLMIIGIYSPDGRYDDTYVANYANLYILDALKRIPGASQTAILGLPDYAMRIWLKPDRMAQLGITANDVVQAVQKQNQQFAVGQIGQAPTDGKVEQTFAVTTKGRMLNPGEFENIILRAGKDGAAILRLKDVGRAQLGSKDYSIRSRMNGKPTTIIAVYQQAGANAIDVSTQVQKTLKELKKGFPDGVDYKIAMDSTKFVRASIKEVIITFCEACLLVIIVVFIFLQSVRATIIPILAVPISIIGTFSGMLLLNFSINMLTMFGMILAIGIVVDDAIVVIENVERNMTQFGLPPKEAAKKAMDEVTGPVIAIVLVLCAVFVPVAFLSGMTGQLYKQFAVTIAISVVISGLVALTLSPAMAAILLKPQHGEKHGFFSWFERRFGDLTDGYTKGVKRLISHRVVALVVVGIMLLGVVFLFRHIPTSFVPSEDQGYVLGASFLPDAASLDRTQAVNVVAGKIFAKYPAVQDVVEVDGYSLIDGQTKANAGLFFVSLKDYEERKSEILQAPALIEKSMRELAGIREGVVIAINPPSIPGLGSTGGFAFWVQSRGEGDAAKLEGVVHQVLAKAAKHPALHGVSSTFRAASQQLRLDVDAERAENLGIPVDDVYDTLQILFGSTYASQFNKSSRLWQVILQAEPKYRSRPTDIDQVYVRSRDGKMVPLKAVVSTRYTTGPDLVTRFNGFPAAQIIGNPSVGHSSGQAIAAMEQIAHEVLPADYSYAWSGQAFEEKKTGGTSFMVFVFGLIMVFLILAAQYEKWSLPFGVIMAVPFAVFGALAAIQLRGIENDVYFQIGLITLIALASKNAILIFEFAVMKHKEGLSIYDAAVEAAHLRLRPIAMTSLAFVLGCVPLAVATGASANSRHSIGTGVIGGMLGATLIAIFFIPLFFYLLELMSSKLSRKTPNRGGGTEREDDGAVVAEGKGE
ncbi:MAG: multidrug efflux RND transporter permease subunit [Syntrophus sp. SKADARSKE-3]|nr:multidrug efflux RND transporter permease subunit [Syntrophus sp. SKADARSKE-3]